MKNIIIFAKSTVEKSPRTKRFLDFCLKNQIKVTLVSSGIENPNLNTIDHITVKHNEKSRIFRAFIKILKKVFTLDIIQLRLNKFLLNLSVIEKILKHGNYDFIYFADIEFLPIIAKNKKKEKIIFDAREYYPLQFENNFNFRIFEKNEYTNILTKYLSYCDIVYTVSKGLSDAYNRNFKKNMKIIYSCPYFHQVEVKKINNNRIKLLYHGMANRNRKIESYFQLLKLLKFDSELNLYLVGDIDYINELKILSFGNKNINFHEPVSLDSIVAMASDYDIGLCYFEPTTFNLKHCLPNKFFEYIQARIIVASGPSPDIVRIINEYKCGIISNEFTIQSLADSINSLSIHDINLLKNNTVKAAAEVCFENQEHIFMKDLNLYS